MKHRATTVIIKLRAAMLLLGLMAAFAMPQTASALVKVTSVSVTADTPTPTLTFDTPAGITVTVGSTGPNPATSSIADGGAITYSSADTSIATVNADTGVVTGVAAGTTTITATQATKAGVNSATSATYEIAVSQTSFAVTAADADKFTVTMSLALKNQIGNDIIILLKDSAGWILNLVKGNNFVFLNDMQPNADGKTVSIQISTHYGGDSNYTVQAGDNITLNGHRSISTTYPAPN